MDTSIYYVYQLVDPRSGVTFYVGKGKGKRASYHTRTVKNGRSTDNPHKDAVIRSILTEGFEPSIIFHTERMSEGDAYDLEARLIAEYGRRTDGSGVLTNICLDSRPPTPDPVLCSKRAKGQTHLREWCFPKGVIPWNKGQQTTAPEKKRNRQREYLKAWRLSKYGPTKPKLTDEEKRMRDRERLKAWRSRQKSG